MADDAEPEQLQWYLTAEKPADKPLEKAAWHQPGYVRPVEPEPDPVDSRPWFRKWWVWALVVLALVGGRAVTGHTIAAPQSVIHVDVGTMQADGHYNEVALDELGKKSAHACAYPQGISILWAGHPTTMKAYLTSNGVDLGYLVWYCADHSVIDNELDLSKASISGS